MWGTLCPCIRLTGSPSNGPESEHGCQFFKMIGGAPNYAPSEACPPKGGGALEAKAPLQGNGFYFVFETSLLFCKLGPSKRIVGKICRVPVLEGVILVP